MQVKDDSIEVDTESFDDYIQVDYYCLCKGDGCNRKGEIFPPPNNGTTTPKSDHKNKGSFHDLSIFTAIVALVAHFLIP